MFKLQNGWAKYLSQNRFEKWLFFNLKIQFEFLWEIVVCYIILLCLLPFIHRREIKKQCVTMLPLFSTILQKKILFWFWFWWRLETETKTPNKKMSVLIVLHSHCWWADLPWTLVLFEISRNVLIFLLLWSVYCVNCFRVVYVCWKMLSNEETSNTLQNDLCDFMWICILLVIFVFSFIFGLSKSVQPGRFEVCLTLIRKH